MFSDPVFWRLSIYLSPGEKLERIGAPGEGISRFSPSRWPFPKQTGRRAFRFQLAGPQ